MPIIVSAGRQLLLSTLLILAVTPSTHAQLLGALSEREEIELGARAAEAVEADLELLTDDIVAAYVSELGQALADRSARSALAYHFKVVNTEEINAFALPGGFIYVNRGLIEATATEGELAGVMGHEIGHVVARHGAEQAQRAAIASLGLRVLDAALGRGTGAQVGTLAAQMVATGTFMKFSREAEREADRLGAENVVAAGHNALGMITFFEQLAGLQEGQANIVEQFFSSHPSPADRVSNIRDLIGLPTDGPQLADDSERFRQVKARLAELPAPPVSTPAAAPAETADALPGTDRDPAPFDPDEWTYTGIERDYEIAGRFAPVFQQALGSSPCFDYITRFDFDGDWQGDNNWENADEERYSLAGAVYFNVSETRTHYLIHYAVFHPRDYKGGNIRGVVLSEVIREAATRHGRYDPSGLAQEAVLAHENDMEGALVVVRKADTRSAARVVYVETLAHNQFLSYRVERRFLGLFATGDDGVRLEDGHPVLFIEPKGHGIEAFRAGQLEDDDVAGVKVYRYTGEAEEPSARVEVGYDLISMATTLWPRAADGGNATYDGAFDYGTWTVRAAAGGEETESEIVLGRLGALFRGVVGGRNMARPPWGWFDRDEQDRRQGEWFFSPAETIRRHFDLDESFSTTYIHHPIFGVLRDQ